MMNIFYDKKYFTNMSSGQVFEFFKFIVIAKGIECIVYDKPTGLKYIAMKGIQCEDCIVCVN